MKKIFFIFLGIVISLIASAEEVQINGIWYVLDEGGQTAEVSYEGGYSSGGASYQTQYAGNIVIPSRVVYDGVTYTVNAIRGSAFYHAPLTSISLPNTIKSIGSKAFMECYNLSSITLPPILEELGQRAFESCTSLTSISFPSTLSLIQLHAFKNCTSLSSLNLQNIKTIEGYAFSGCSSLTDLVIPDCVNSIDSWAFENCTSLSTVSIGSGISYCSMLIFEGCNNVQSVYINSPYLAQNNYFYGTQFIDFPSASSLTFGDSVTILKGEIIRGFRNISSLTIPSSVRTIEKNALNISPFNKNLRSAGPIGGGDYNIQFGWADSIPENAFSGLSTLESIAFPSTTTYIPAFSFDGCKNLSALSLPNVVKIDKAAFRGCSSLSAVEFPSTLQLLGDEAFSGCSNLQTVFFAPNIDSIAFAEKVFYGCGNLTEIDLPASLTSIGNSAFAYCSTLPSISIPQSVREIGGDAFSYCDAITSMTIPNTVNSIGGGAFANCSNLSDLVLSDDLHFISGRLCNGCSKLSNLSISDSIVLVGDSAFYNCSLVRRVNLKYAHYIGYAAFAYSGLDSLELSSELDYISSYAFQHTCLAHVKVPEGPRFLGDYAFSHTLNMKSVVLPSTMQTINTYAFAGNMLIRDFTCYAATPPTCRNKTFSEFSSATLHVPSGTESLYENAFAWSDFSSIVAIVQPSDTTQDTTSVVEFPDITIQKSVPYSESFINQSGSFTTVDFLKDNFVGVWSTSSYGMKANAYANSTRYESDSWLISPFISLPTDSSVVLSFDHVYRYTSQPSSQLTLLISTDLMSWDELTIPAYSTGSDWNFVNSGEISLDDYLGKNIILAFRYISTTQVAATWEIKNFNIKAIPIETGLNPIFGSNNATKCIINGHLFIQRNGHKYTATGTMIE